MNPIPDAHFPIRRLTNEQLAHAILRSAAIRGESGFLVDAQGAVKPLVLRVSLGLAQLTMAPAASAEPAQP